MIEQQFRYLLLFAAMVGFLLTILVYSIPCHADTITPMTRWSEKITKPDGSSVIRCYTEQNPHYYIDSTTRKLTAIDAVHTEKKPDLVSGKKNYIVRTKAPVIASVKKDLSADGYLTFVPDDKFGTTDEEISFSLISVKRDGSTVPVVMSTGTVDGNEIDKGELKIYSTRNSTKQLVPYYGEKYFRIEFLIRAKGLAKAVWHEASDQYFFYGDNGKFRFRLAAPKFIDAKMQPLITTKDGPDYSDAITHTITDNGNGTYTYIKESGKRLEEIAKLIPDGSYIDADTVYSSTSDGDVWYYQNYDWNLVHDAATGTHLNLAGTNYIQSAGGHDSNYYIARGFLYFPLSIAGTISGVTLNLYRADPAYGVERTLCPALGTQSDTLSTADFDACIVNSPTIYGTSGDWDTPDSEGARAIPFNADGITDANTYKATTWKICLRDKTHDIDDTAPARDGALDSNERIHATDYTGTSKDPYLEVTYSTASRRIMMVQ